MLFSLDSFSLSDSRWAQPCSSFSPLTGLRCPLEGPCLPAPSAAEAMSTDLFILSSVSTTCPPGKGWGLTLGTLILLQLAAKLFQHLPLLLQPIPSLSSLLWAPGLDRPLAPGLFSHFFSSLGKDWEWALGTWKGRGGHFCSRGVATEDGAEECRHLRHPGRSSSPLFQANRGGLKKYRQGRRREEGQCAYPLCSTALLLPIQNCLIHFCLPPDSPEIVISSLHPGVWQTLEVLPALEPLCPSFLPESSWPLQVIFPCSPLNSLCQKIVFCLHGWDVLSQLCTPWILP